ncbi:MAG: hypothetical protein LBK25_03870 [Treponema sp.]|jgi:hypothetical protein|nr:hypothetical protein [Treponema sp.]
MKKTMLFFFAIMLNSCISIARFSYEKTGDVIDHSFDATGDIIETGKFTYIKESFLPWKKKAIPQSGINISGKIRHINKSPSKVLMWVHPNENETLFIGPWHLVYQWNGTITFDGKTEQAELFFHAYSSDKDGYSKYFEYSDNPVSVYIGHKGFTTGKNKEYIELRSFPIDIVTDFPYPLGSLTTEQNTYKLYMTTEVEYILINDSELTDEEVEQRYGFFRGMKIDFPTCFTDKTRDFRWLTAIIP